MYKLQINPERLVSNCIKDLREQPPILKAELLHNQLILILKIQE